jgi:hypothetical protein
MIRLHAVVEGQTEETFVNQVLVPVLADRNVVMDVRCVETGRKRSGVFRGGVTQYRHLKTNLTLWMKQDQKPETWFTTMVDLYALPDDFPGYADCRKHADPVVRVECLEEGLLADLSHCRFIPYIQLHEFEALLFSDPRPFENAFPSDPAVTQKLAAIRSQFPTPEHIDDRRDMAPSKRILAVLPDYKKTVAGVQIAQQIGLTALRQECPYFNQWIAKIEAVAAR